MNTMQDNELQQGALNVLAETQETICETLDKLAVIEKELRRLLEANRTMRAQSLMMVGGR